jgi:hypothetical protein
MDCHSAREGMIVRMLEKLDNFGDLCSVLASHLQERVRFFPCTKPRLVEDVSSSQSAKLLGPVVYWTHHALRTDENPALDVACELARSLGTSLVVYQGLSENYRFASDRHHCFALQAAQDLERQCEQLGVRYVFHMDRRGYRVPALKLMSDLASVLVTDDFRGSPRNFG